MNRPTSTSTGAVATPGTSPSSGDRNMNGRNNRPVTTAVRPVRPPALTPAADSMYEVPLELPTRPEKVVEMASANIALPTFLGVPSGSVSPATLVTPTKVEMLSNMSVNSSANTGAMRATLSTPLRSSCSTVLNDGSATSESGRLTSPSTQPNAWNRAAMRVVAMMAISSEPVTLRTSSTP